MIEFPAADAPRVTTAQMREVDRLMTEVYGIGLLQMAENAGRHLAELARICFLGGDARNRQVHVLAGTGGNGAGGLVAARRLHGWGARVTVAITREAGGYAGVPGQELDILVRLGVPLQVGGPTPEDADLIVDALVGYSLTGPPRGTVAAQIEQVTRYSGVPILSLDVPSGVDATTGEAHSPAVRAAATLTLALPKTGLLIPAASDFVGELYVADIGVPPQLYASPGLDLQVGSLFARVDLLRLV